MWASDEAQGHELHNGPCSGAEANSCKKAVDFPQELITPGSFSSQHQHSDARSQQEVPRSPALLTQSRGGITALSSQIEGDRGALFPSLLS